MFAYRDSIGPVDLAFTDRIGGVSATPFAELNLAVGSLDPAVGENIELVRQAFGPDDAWIHLRQVHGSHVHLAEPSLLTPEPSRVTPEPSLPEADAAVATTAGLTLSVRAADCVPVLLADPDARVIGAAHAGRAGVVAGVVPETVRVMGELGADRIQAWIGPYVCGACYEVPQELQDQAAAVVAQTVATTSWGTPSLDLGAGIRAQLEAAGVEVRDVSRCTRESPDLYSYRRDGAMAGRHAGIIRMRP